jgi:hypothetical protein
MRMLLLPCRLLLTPFQADCVGQVDADKNAVRSLDKLANIADH